jgi:hypothetical protein
MLENRMDRPKARGQLSSPNSGPSKPLELVFLFGVAGQLEVGGVSHRVILFGRIVAWRPARLPVAGPVPSGACCREAIEGVDAIRTSRVERRICDGG